MVFRQGSNFSGAGGINYHPAYYLRRRPYLPPRRMSQLIQGNPGAQEVLVDVGRRLVSEVNEETPLEDQLGHLEDVWREKFEAIVEPLVESTKEAVAEALAEFTSEQEARRETVGPVDEETAMSWLATGVLMLGALIAGAGLGDQIKQGEYSAAALWALGLILAAAALLKGE